MGMSFCFNRDTKLYYIEEPVYDKKDVKDGYIKCLNPDEYVAFTPKFSQDYSKLLYLGSKE